MYKIKVIIMSFLLVLTILPAQADTTGYVTLSTYVIGAITFNVTGILTANINADTGALSNSLGINYAMTTNGTINNLQFKAVVLNSSGSKSNAFYSTGTSGSTQTMFLVLGNTDFPPSTTSISNCQQATSTPSLNPNAIAYQGTITIDNKGVMSYNASGGYYSFIIKKNTTNLNMSIVTNPKTGTFDAATAADEIGPYKVEIYIDNIPP